MSSESSSFFSAEELLGGLPARRASTLFSRFNINYPQLFEGVHTTFKFQERIDGYVHVEVRKLYLDAELPRSEYPISTEDQLVMIYISTRPFANLADGLITGCIEHFGEKIDIQRENLAENGTSARFTVAKQG